MNFTDYQTAHALVHPPRPQEIKRRGQCEIDDCDGDARHTSPRDKMRLCDICWEIELDQIGIEEDNA